MEANQILDRVLTRWCNLHLPQEYQVEGLGGFEDEGTLVYLLEKVSSKKIGSSGAKRRMSFSKKWRYVDIALDFIEKEEGVEMERAVQSKEVAKGERGSLRALLWSLVLHYLVKPTLSSFPPSSPGAEGHTITDRLKSFVSDKLPPHLKSHLVDLTLCWRDGMLLSALVSTLLPPSSGPGAQPQQGEGECPPGADQRPLEACVADVACVLQLAQTKLGIPEVLLAGELCSEAIDERSVTVLLCYLLASSPELLMESMKVGRGEKAGELEVAAQNSLILSVHGPSVETHLNSEHLKCMVRKIKDWGFGDYNVVAMASNLPQPLLYSKGESKGPSFVAAKVWVRVLVTDLALKSELTQALNDIKDTVIKTAFKDAAMLCVTVHPVSVAEIFCTSLLD